MNGSSKKIVILGPVVTSSYFGGVATFDEGLAIGLKNFGCEVVIATSQKNAININKELRIEKVNRKKFKELVNTFQPDFIISELGYAKYYIFNRSTTKKIYYIHAFFKQSYYGVLKSNLAVWYQKLLIRFSDAVISNSHFTAMVNHDFYGIESDAVCEVGLKDEFCEKVSQKIGIKRETNSIFFAARLVPAKGAEIVINAVKFLFDRDQTFHLYVAGDGPEKERLVNIVDRLNLPITLLGRLDQDQMIEQYLKSDVFISLDRSEPYGIVFLEALVAGCKIVCPLTGGQMEILKDYREYVSYVDVNDPQDIADGIQFALNNDKYPNLSASEKKNLTYSATAEKLLRILGNMY